MPVTLESRARRMQVFHLPHDVFCRDQCACADVTVVVVAENPRTGERAPKRVTKKAPGTITLLALERKPGLPSALLDLAQVKAAIGRGYLRVIEQTPDKAAVPAAAVAAPGSPTHSPAQAAIPVSPSPAATSSSPAPAPPPTAAAKPLGKEA